MAKAHKYGANKLRTSVYGDCHIGHLELTRASGAWSADPANGIASVQESGDELTITFEAGYAPKALLNAWGGHSDGTTTLPALLKSYSAGAAIIEVAGAVFADSDIVRLTYFANASEIA